MRVILTRPEREAGRWLASLAAHGIDACALPLISIAAVPDAARLQAAWNGLEAFDAVMFVSGSAVQHFFEANSAKPRVGGSKFAIKTRAWAPGPGTAAALADAGVPLAAIDAPDRDAGQFDSESLWQQVAGQARPGARVLIVRGGDAQGQGAGRDWLAAQLVAAGVQVDTVVAYLRRAPHWHAQQLALAAQAAADGWPWLFSSSQAIANLGVLLPQQDWSAARAVATHPRIAQAARTAGFGVVCESRPTVEAIVAALKSMR